MVLCSNVCSNLLKAESVLLGIILIFCLIISMLIKELIVEDKKIDILYGNFIFYIIF